MDENFSLLIAQLNPSAGALAHNAEKAELAHKEATEKKLQLIALPEMFLTGYQIQDLVFKRAFIENVSTVLEKLAKCIKAGPPMLIGAPAIEENSVFNAYYLLIDGKFRVVARKHHLPNSNVFDERRVFSSGPVSGPIEVSQVRLGTPICEDFWFEDVADTLVKKGADILLSPNGSPYARNKIDVRAKIMAKRSIQTELPIVYLNLVGGQDDLVFDGGSFVLNPGGELALQLPQFDEVTGVVEFSSSSGSLRAKTGFR